MFNLIISLLTALTVNAVGTSASISAKSSVKVRTLNISPSNLLILDAEVNSRSIETLLDRLRSIEAPGKEVYLLITSPGGSVIDGGRLLAFMRDSKMKIHTICDTFCASMAATIHQYGKKRYIVGKSLFMLHPARGGLSGTVPEMKSFLGVLDRYLTTIDKYIVKRSKLNWNKYRALVDNTFWLTSTEAIRCGFAESIAKVNIKRSILPGSKPFSLRKALTDKGIKVKNTGYKYLEMFRSFR